MENKIEKARDYINICKFHRHKKKLLKEIILIFYVMSFFSHLTVELSQVGLIPTIRETTLLLFNALFYFGIATIFLYPILDYETGKIEIEERAKLFDTIPENEIEKVMSHPDAKLEEPDKECIRYAYELNRMFDSIN